VGAVIHLAAESHVDRRSWAGGFHPHQPAGTYQPAGGRPGALGTARGLLFHHVSTDECSARMGEGCFTKARLRSAQPVLRTKRRLGSPAAAAGRPTGCPSPSPTARTTTAPTSSREADPLMILNLLEERPLPVYGDGANVRDWLHVEDHSRALWPSCAGAGRGALPDRGPERVAESRAGQPPLRARGRPAGQEPRGVRRLISFVPDRPGHDLRSPSTAPSSARSWAGSPRWTRRRLGEHTIRWYKQNPAWVQRVRQRANTGNGSEELRGAGRAIRNREVILESAHSLLALCAALAAASWPTRAEGSLQLIYLRGPAGRTLEPPLDMNVASYNLTGLGPEGLPSSARGSRRLDHRRFLAPAAGRYVDGLQLRQPVIGTGSADAVVVAGATTASLIVVSPLAGDGLLQLTVTWPSGQLSNPSCGTLAPVGGSPTALPSPWPENRPPTRTRPWPAATIAEPEPGGRDDRWSGEGPSRCASWPARPPPGLFP